jgi:iron complex outermembrane receptor protein
MSEQAINRYVRNALKRELLITVSAMALCIAPANVNTAKADDGDHPTVWIELGGQLETAIGTEAPFTPNFFSVYGYTAAIKAIEPHAQLGSHFTNGGEGSISFEPEDSNWVFSAAALYGRSNTHIHVHQQTVHLEYEYIGPYHGFYPGDAKTADLVTKADQSHAIIDFQAGRDVGLGLFGRDGSSTINAGVRFAQFASHADITIRARPDPHYHFWTFRYPAKFPIDYYQTYHAVDHASRSFRGIGPSLSWKGMSSILGEANSGQLALDWSANGAVLFGRQKANIHHQTTGIYWAKLEPVHGHPTGFSTDYTNDKHLQRAHSVVVPDLGASVAFTYRIESFKVNVGYRGDFFFGAMDTGGDVARKSNVSFYGPFAAISVGLGG